MSNIKLDKLKAIKEALRNTSGFDSLDKTAQKEKDSLENISSKETIKESNDYTEKEISLKEFELKKEDADEERTLRSKHAKYAFRFSLSWMIFIGIVIFMHAMCPKFDLTEIEFMGVIGSLTVSVFGFYVLVLKYLFYRPKE